MTTKKWMNFVGEHMTIEQITDNAIVVKNASFIESKHIRRTDLNKISEHKEWFDDVILKNELGKYEVYSVSQDDKRVEFYAEFESIREYLGY